MLLALLLDDEPVHLAGLGEPATTLIDRTPRVRGPAAILLLSNSFTVQQYYWERWAAAVSRTAADPGELLLSGSSRFLVLVPAPLPMTLYGWYCLATGGFAGY